MLATTGNSGAPVSTESQCFTQPVSEEEPMLGAQRGHHSEHDTQAKENADVDTASDANEQDLFGASSADTLSAPHSPAGPYPHKRALRSHHGEMGSESMHRIKAARVASGACAMHRSLSFSGVVATERDAADLVGRLACTPTSSWGGLPALPAHRHDSKLGSDDAAMKARNACVTGPF